MGQVIIAAGAGSAASDECTLYLQDVPSGLKAVAADSDDDVAEGTLDVSTTADPAHVLSGHTYMSWDGSHWKKNTGILVVGTLGSFSVAAYSTSQVTATWQNPAYNPKNGICFSGVIIRYKTDGYPTNPTDGTLGYMGTGSNSEASGISSATISELEAGATYYFSCFPYFTCSIGNYIVNNVKVMTDMLKQAIGNPTAHGTITITSSGTVIIPPAVRSMTITAVGGGGGGSCGGYDTHSPANAFGGAGGAGGYQSQETWSVTPGDSMTVVIGAGGAGGAVSKGGTGGTTTVTYGTKSLSAAGGSGGENAAASSAGGTGATKGGSGANAGSSRSDADNGEVGTSLFYNNLSGSGGGGGAERDLTGGDDNAMYIIGSRGTASSGGGSGSSSVNASGSNGTANTGGGGGGGFGLLSWNSGSFSNGGNGGSGVVIITY